MRLTLSEILKVVQPEQRPSVGFAKLVLGELNRAGFAGGSNF